MNKIDSLNQVGEFHKTFNAPILDNPQIPSKQRCELRVSLLQEELNELSQAIKDNDIVEVIDALCDLQYVLSGAVLEFGLGERFVEFFDEVQKSNMTKACSTIEEAEETILFYKNREKEPADGYWKEMNGKYIVLRKGDDKVLKSVKYTPANINGLLNKI